MRGIRGWGVGLAALDMMFCAGCRLVDGVVGWAEWVGGGVEWVGGGAEWVGGGAEWVGGWWGGRVGREGGWVGWRGVGGVGRVGWGGAGTCTAPTKTASMRGVVPSQG